MTEEVQATAPSESGNSYIDNAVNESNAVTEAQEEVTETTETAEVVEEVSEEKAEASTEAEAVEAEKPAVKVKTLENALSRHQKKAHKLKAAIKRAKEAEAAILPTPPKEEDFVGKTHEELVDARAAYAADKRFNERVAEQANNEAKAAHDEMQAEMIEHVNQSEVRAKEVFPDFDSLIESNMDKNTGRVPLSEAALEALQQSGEPATALGMVLKDGLLNELNAALTPVQAAFLVKDSLDKALNLSKPKPKLSAPTPITSAKGTGTGTKSIHEKSNDDILAFMKS